MNPNACLAITASEDKKTLYLRVTDGQNLLFLGSTLATAAAVGTCGLTSLTFGASPKETGRIDVIAVSVLSRGEWHSFLLEVSFRKEPSFADKPAYIWLDREHVPNQGRLATLATTGIRLNIDGEIYTTAKADSYPDGEHFVPDGNLVCRYLACQAEADEVLAAAEIHEAEATLTEIVKAELAQLEYPVDGQSLPSLIRQACADLKTVRDTLKCARNWLDPENELHHHAVDSLANAKTRSLENTQKELATALTLGDHLRQAITKMIWRGGRARTALDNWVRKFDPPKWA